VKTVIESEEAEAIEVLLYRV